MTALVISGIDTVAARLAIATVTIAIQRARYGIRYGSIRHRSELARRRCGGGAMAGAERRAWISGATT
ncbi:methyltransferase type 11 [Mycolicibacterium novocastrense]|uniref:Methyltransferase type 11 n=1 Tax=Mycolicibacterium novocastrense TaxID=59813 RepID=A0ABQ0KT15_MYCNV|nr:methyltransferase type 11 [Mycolicibacterium novocastrense]